MSSLSISSFQDHAGQSPRRLFGYDVIERLGSGAGSTIYAVTDPATHQLFALKHVARSSDRDIRFVEQLEAEHEVGQKVQHAGLRRSIDFKVNRRMFKVIEAALVLELFDGTPLETDRPDSLADLLGIFGQTAEALGALHQAGYVHCDLKPNNIMVGRGGRVKVIDLGQAAATGTAKQRIQGTPDYISPEQVRCKPVTPATDVYNLGATMYFCLSGRTMPTLFTIKRDENSLLVDELIDPPCKLNPQVPETLSNFVMECVRLNPAKRPDDMRAIIARLNLFEHMLRQREAN